MFILKTCFIKNGNYKTKLCSLWEFNKFLKKVLAKID